MAVCFVRRLNIIFNFREINVPILTFVTQNLLEKGKINVKNISSLTLMSYLNILIKLKFRCSTVHLVNEEWTNVAFIRIVELIWPLAVLVMHIKRNALIFEKQPFIIIYIYLFFRFRSTCLPVRWESYKEWRHLKCLVSAWRMWIMFLTPGYTSYSEKKLFYFSRDFYVCKCVINTKKLPLNRWRCNLSVFWFLPFKNNWYKKKFCLFYRRVPTIIIC